MKRPMLRLHNPHLKNKVHGHSTVSWQELVLTKVQNTTVQCIRLESNADTNPGAAPFSRGFAKIYLECVITYASLGGNGGSGDDMPGVASVTSRPSVGD
ncbi:unnamed protein product [Brassica rapa]|uniref:Uncharacterized protein n=1 Tax=Brassica campestris TaxID=3711 RepID=A0A8D9GYG8_BRACM|nr:unnamed protein product [Brassica rapa]